MMNNKVNNVPKLRFKEFSEEWVRKTLGEMGTLKNGINKDSSDFGFGVPFLNLMDVFGRIEINKPKLDLVNASKTEINQYQLLAGDVLFVRSSVKREGVGETVVCNYDLPNTVYSGFLIRFRSNNILNGNFKKYCFWEPKFRLSVIKMSTTSANTNINQESLNKLLVNFPCAKEQQKIANFLSSVDNKLQALKQKHQLLQQYKKGMMQKLFSQQIRFKDENGQDYPEWKEVLLKTLSDKVTAKNKDESVSFVLTNSAKQGIVSQTDYFTKDIANENNLGNYTIVNTDDFVYNPRISELAPYGPIKRNHISVGVMSPLYTVFRFKDKSLFDYIEFYFETDRWHKYMWNISNFGARSDRMNISNNDFFNLPLSIPSKDERVKIANFLSAIDQKIDGVTKQIEQTALFKKGLLQQLFV